MTNIIDELNKRRNKWRFYYKRGFKFMIKLLFSSVGKKLINGISAVCVVGFILVHLIGNFTLLDRSGQMFNAYSYFLNSLGEIILAAEIMLLVVFLFHIISSIIVTLDSMNARPIKYMKIKNAGNPSFKSVSSETMIYTGLLLLIFLTWHVTTFRFGPGIAEGYTALLNGKEVRDVHKLVSEFFTHPVYLPLYLIVMGLLGFHFRHGFWSMFQTLGFHHPRYTKLIYTGGTILAILLTTGFLFLPIWVFFTTGGNI
jgi:succinate dehydrogenase / fumarate reductase cytochrome b subunit